MALRVAAAAAGPLIDDEAYYWLWARQLAWGYLDHPPMVAWLIALTTMIGDSAFAIRLGPLMLGLLTSYTLFLLGREMSGPRAGLVAAALFQIVPVLAGAGLLATPDAPLLLCWAATLRFAWQALHGRSRRWLAAGGCIGLGLLSKLTMVWLPAGLFLYVAFRAPRVLRSWPPYGGAVLAAALSAPVVFWNAHHAWAGADYLLTRRLTGASPGVAGIVKLLEEQIPFTLALCPAFIWVLLVPLRRRGEVPVFLVVTALPALIFPFLPAYAGAWPHGNWLAPVYLHLTLVLAAVWTRAAALPAALNAVAIAYVLAAASFSTLPLPPGAEEVYGWAQAASRAAEEIGSLGPGAVVVADRYQIAAQLGYHLRGTPVALLPCPHPGSIWPRPETVAGRNAVTVLDARWAPTVDWARAASRVEEAQAVVITARGRPVRTFRLYRLYNLRPPACP
ncbi:MAG: glycosyltransferase family 39 protein [Armatimonadota bacterium]|nr:glycosyltransferase family 39 protein [Armatimonadota bacterium]MDR7466519.1 glycosyltransferase family 39 protein [Armatimonadota bacterium]MDR7493241.1 glycosyltransferase family 39 protein [Armatimonadota bacterium]MDR7504715.1 glycosyltransferase family 39 protein [Armatimonadota bacterium]MDR7545719.1 glycosyltransferase family 39 protein [Armatimonadota bacterium]